DGPTNWEGLVATVHTASPNVRSGRDVEGTLRLTNTGTAPVTFDSGEPLTGVVVKRGTTTPVGAYLRPIAGVGKVGTLGPGESTTIHVLLGTSSCDLSLGYAVPPGSYDVIVPVILRYPQNSGDPVEVELVSQPSPLEVVA